MSRKPFSQFNVCEKLESGKLLQFIVFQTFDSKLLFLKLNYGSRTREGNENVRDQSSCQISGNLGLTCLQEKKKKRGWGASFFVAGNSTLLMHASLVFFQTLFYSTTSILAIFGVILNEIGTLNNKVTRRQLWKLNFGKLNFWEIELLKKLFFSKTGLFDNRSFEN